MNKPLFKSFLLFLFITLISQVYAREYVIFSISQNFPLHENDKEIKKNYYINMGKNQGLGPGALVDVTRTISRQDPYDNQVRYNFKVKIGELKILHVENEASIGKLNKLENAKDIPYFEIDQLMIGDEVQVHVK